MTFVYDLHFAKHSLTVPDESARALFYDGTNWIITAFDSMINENAQFRVPGILALRAAESLEMKRPIDRRDGKAFMAWLLKQDYLLVDRLKQSDRSSQFPPHMTAGPRPSMDRPAPSTSTSPAKPLPATPEYPNPAYDHPHKPNQPVDRPGDPSI